ncbi:glycoside hydrolase family 16 protein [Flavobacteriaceae bacterium]|nr:glycoside hydrolase family 16 protein [Flavobacteriaceae bacterium]MDC1471964.1 glycoside hydrolase family 16 protein [Flavobacteriaceae bacterium]MDC1539614.1 glycoside hydrolase family 16 protein [Flavobacteriaceae bacterium]
MNKNNKKTMRITTLLFTTFALASMISFTSCDTNETQTVATFSNLTMSDEFDVEGAPNSDIWSFETGTGTDGWGNNELQYYTDRPENVTVQNGLLVITALKEEYNGASYTSARLITKGKFKQAYGRFEARIKVPGGSGLWPAFWLLGENFDVDGWPQCGEIDIMEYRRQEPTKVSGSVHGPGYSGETDPQGQVTKSYDLGNNRYDAGFHVFGIEWGPEYINYYIDDVLYNQITPSDIEVTPADVVYTLNDAVEAVEATEESPAVEAVEATDVTGDWVFNKPFYIIINLAVGGDFPGNPDDGETFPQNMLVDYVRVYNQ